MTSTQEYLLKLLLEIDTICKKYDIEYFIDYGTTLGAIRHEGFIPWDDDIDITMTEDNYYKWVEACRKELDPSRRLFKDVRMDREYPLVFGRYMDIETARISPKFEFWKNACGQCIDVFYMVELPGDPVKKAEAIELFFAYDEYCNSSFRHSRYRSEKGMQLYREFCEMEKEIGKDAVLKKLEERIFHKHYDDCDTYLVASARRQGPPSIVPKRYYDSVYMADFEGYKLPIAGHYVELMNVYYEDTFNMLPQNVKKHQDMSHNGIPCKAYVDDYMQLLDKDKMLAARQKFKHLEVEEGYRMTRIRKAFFEKMGSCEVLKVKRKIEQNHLDIADYLVPDDKTRLAVLDDLFSDYYEKQMDKAVRYWQVYFKLDDDLIYAALFNLLYGRHDFYSIAKILHIREVNGFKPTDKIAALWNVVLTIRRIRAQLIYRNYDLAAESIREGIKIAPHCRDIQVGSLLLDVATAKNAGDLSACRDKAETLLGLYPENDECIKALGDIAYMSGDKDEAMRHYDWVNENSRNGMLHLDIKKRMEGRL
ncbi:MAG: LicD family protein [Eubacterium sp.]|nr:LicD family protein [Eubacterium sp.]